MSVFCLSSGKGAPGVTTTALVLAGVWPSDRRVILVEADPSGGTVAAVYHLDTRTGLLSLAAARPVEASQPSEHVQTVSGGLSVLVAPSNPRSARSVIRDTAGVVADWGSEPGLDLVVDCGRLGPDHPAALLLGRADRVLVLAHPRVDQLVPTANVVPDADGVEVSLLLVGTKPYRPEQVEESFGLPVAGSVAWDPHTAAALTGQGGLSESRLVRSRLLGSLVPLAQRLVAEAATAEERPGQLPSEGEVVGWTS